MDYGGLVKRALDVMWKFKYLWIFGFFLEFGSGTGGWFGNLPERCKLPVGDFISGALVGAIIFLVLIGLLIFLVFLIMYLISQGGLNSLRLENRVRRKANLARRLECGHQELLEDPGNQHPDFDFHSRISCNNPGTFCGINHRS